MDIYEFIRSYLGLIIICSPFTAIPAFLSLTEGRSHIQKRKVGVVAGLTVTVVLLGIAWVGTPIMKFFGVGLSTFQVAGGVILFLLALVMLQGGINSIAHSTKDKQSLKNEPVGVVPLGIPLMAGPGAISTVVLISGLYPGFWNIVIISVCLLLVGVSMSVCLLFAGTLEKFLGKTGLKVLNSLGGLIIAIIAVDVFSKGVYEIFPGLR